jgi:hypothetical protein
VQIIDCSESYRVARFSVEPVAFKSDNRGSSPVTAVRGKGIALESMSARSIFTVTSVRGATGAVHECPVPYTRLQG